MLLLLTLLACDHLGGAERFPITGRILELRGGDELLVEHDAIPGFMDAMTMPLAADPPAFGTYQPGDVIRGTLRVSEDGTRIVDVRIVGHEQLDPLGSAADPAVGSVLAATRMPSTEGELTVGAGQGVPTVLTFLFTSCPVAEYCPLLASKLAQLQPLIRDRARIVAVSLDPARDSLEVLAQYGRERGADPAIWHFARLEEPALGELLERVGGLRTQAPGTITHNLRLLALDADGRILALYRDNTWDPAEVVAHFPPAR